MLFKFTFDWYFLKNKEENLYLLSSYYNDVRKEEIEIFINFFKGGCYVNVLSGMFLRKFF